MSKLVIYHGSKDIIEKPYYHGGKAENDYGFGFYCTENLDLAKEFLVAITKTMDLQINIPLILLVLKFWI